LLLNYESQKHYLKGFCPGGVACGYKFIS